ncbi:unnamed protein product [Eruca vesicaria subsp. sativa]|uniref:Dof zinc finger protein n=1 Tax=Eruca vesicaria subsp. sativa TaxID=29727 RepID=A0ABC8IY23_ERUVS|nr:unnamed protein product [Eruca vesicaria subsp. sativa]
MTASDSSAMRPHTVTTNQQQQQQEPLPCPRCESTNTKFCYYNNYNFSQPRHFCKSCRRYWTHGGTLRDVPVGGRTRKSAKRSRTSSSSSSLSPVNSTSSSGELHSAPLQATPVLFTPFSNGVTTAPLDGKGSSLSLCGSFTSLLNQNANNIAAAAHGSGSGYDDISFGLGRAVWPFSTNVGSNGGGHHHGVTIPATWQFEGLESNNAAGGVFSGEYFAWPDLSIKTSGNYSHT